MAPQAPKPPNLNPPNPAAPDISILGESLTIHPAGYTENVTDDSLLRISGDGSEDQSRNIIAQMARFRESPLDFLREVSLHVSGTGWRAYEQPIGQPVFYSGFTERMKTKVMNNAMLKGKVRQLARKRVAVEADEGHLNGSGAERERRRRELEASLTDVAEGMVDDMICKMESKRFLRGAYYMVTSLLTRFYHQGIHVSSEEVLRLRAVAQEAAKKKQSIIFLPSHRSHVDYVSMQIICYRLGLGLPTVVAGDNLNFPLVGPFLQHAGAMWIRRSFGDDQLYGTVVQTYIDTLLQNGFNFECFIEGGRSRTGKLLGPKFGILRFILDSLLSGRVDDAVLCPVSCQYDKVIEVDSYISELLGQPKEKESLLNFLSASNILNLRLGRVDIRFHAPWSLRAFMDDQLVRYMGIPRNPTSGSHPSKDKSNWTPDRKIRLLKTLGYRVLADINSVSVVMPTALIGTVLLTLRGRGVGKSELIRRVEWLRDRVRSRGGRVAHFAGLETASVVERGLDVLGPAMVGVIPGLPEETYYAVDRFQLSFYRNMTIHLFILESLLCAGMYTRVKLGGSPATQSMSFADLRSEVSFLSQLFRGEFIFPPEGLDVNMHAALRRLADDQVLQVDTTPDAGVGTDGGLGIATVSLHDAERDIGRENFDFYCFLIWPFIEASWLGAVSMLMLTPPPADSDAKDGWVDSKRAHDCAQLLGKTLYHQGDLSYFEAVNKETLKNAYQRFEEEGMLEARRARNTGAAKIRLTKEWRPEVPVGSSRSANGTSSELEESRLWGFAEAISQSRREGKNRRDGRTVRRRVLGLVELVAGKLWAEERRDEARNRGEKDIEEIGPVEPRKARRRKDIVTNARL